MSELDFLTGDEPEQTPVSEVAQEPQPEAAEAQAEVVNHPEPQTQPVAPQAEPDRPSGQVPLTAMLEERDRRKEAEKRAAEAQRRLEAMQSIPDQYEDPVGYDAYREQAREQAIQQQILDQKLNMSEIIARRDYGAEAVEQARDWALQRFQSDPYYHQRVMSDPHPYDVVYSDWKREQVFTALKPGDMDAFLQWKASQGAPQQQPSPQAVMPPAQTQHAVTPPPRSIVSAPNSGGGVTAIPMGQEAIFNGAFPKG